jgi:hypothetical protein
VDERFCEENEELDSRVKGTTMTSEMYIHLRELQHLMDRSKDARYLVTQFFGLVVDHALSRASRETLRDLHLAVQRLYDRIEQGEQIPTSDWEPFDDVARRIRDEHRSRHTGNGESQ